MFATAVDNPYHDPPHWLNEGLAVYLSDGYDGRGPGRRSSDAASRGTIIPLDGLAGAFPTTRERFFLAYAESVSAVDRIVRVNGRDALVKLIRSYHEGVSDDEAFQAALGRDVAGFNADWLAELGASPADAPGPGRPRRAAAGGLERAAAEPVVRGPGIAAPATPGAPRRGDGLDPLAQFLMPSVSLIGVALVLVIVALVARRARRRARPAGWPADADNRLFGRPRVARIESSSRLWSASGWTLPGDPDEPAGAEPGAAAEPEPPPSREPAPSRSRHRACGQH